MLNDAERKQAIAKIEQLPDLVESTVRGLSDQQLDTTYRDGSWTIRQVIHHLADSHMNGYSRMRMVATEKHPVLKPYDQERWAKLADAKLPLAPSLSILRGLHQRWVEFLKALPQDAWSAKAFHPEHGEMTMDDLLAEYARHGVDHLAPIQRLRQQNSW
jgi:hypothetical protein